MKKSISLKFITLLLVCFAFLLTGALSLTTNSFAKADASYEVIFMLDENTVYDTQYVGDFPYVNVPNTPEKAGKIFEYWQDENGNKFSFKTKIEEDLVLTAVWSNTEHNMISVKFCVNGEVINEQIIKEGQTAVAPVEFDCGDGKEFDYWDKSFNNVSEDLVVNAVLKDKEYTVVLYGFGKEIISIQQIKHGGDFDLPTPSEEPGYVYNGYTGNAQNIFEDGKIYFNYVPIEYTATFLLDGKPFEKLESAQVKYGETVKFPGVVSRPGYVFMGWFSELNSEESFDFSTAVYSNIELHAKLVPVIEKFDVKFFDFDGNQYGGTQSVEQGKSAILPGNPYKEGYEFVGWNGNYNQITADTNVYPIFRIKSYAVKFYNGETLISEQVVNHGDSAVEPGETPEKLGFDFIRWDTNFNKVNSNLEVYAVFEEKTFVVMFYDHDMKKIGATQFVKYGQSAIAPNLVERVGYTFTGWDGDFTNIVEDVVFTPKYQPKVYNLDFYYNGEKVHTQSVEHGKSIDFYAYELEGYLFYGWYLDQELLQPFSFNKKLDGDVVVYAKMQEKPAETFNVIFKGEDGTIVSAQTVEKGQSAILPAGPYKEGYDFSFWEKQSGDGGYGNVQNDLVYIARYTIKTYKVTFVYGTEVYEEQFVSYGENATAPSVDLVGHTFKGWDKDFDIIVGDLTVNAVFEPNEYQVIFKDFESDQVYSTQTVKYGQKVSIPKSPQKDGYLFKKWQLVSDNQTVDFSFDTVITGQTVIFAQFEGKPYSVYYYINGELYLTQKVLYNEQIPEIDEPYYDENYVFSGWGEIPLVMPAKNLTITATVLRYYTVNFVIDGQMYHTERVLEGEKIAIPVAPEYNNVKYSFAWDSVPNVMPDNDLTINGKFELISADKDNELAVVITSFGGKTFISLYVRGRVNIGGMMVNITNKNFANVTATLDENYADYNVNAGTITFVWAQGENVTDFTQLATFVIEGEQIQTSSIKATISAYAFNGDSVVSVNSSTIIIQK